MATQNNRNKTRSNSNNRNNNSRSSKKAPVNEKSSAMGNEVKLILSFAICIILFLCNFSIMGPFGKAVKDVMFGLFGILSFLLPIAVFIAIAFSISNAGHKFVRRKVFSGAVLLYCIGVIAEMIAVNMDTIGGNLLKDLFFASQEGYKGGGVLCGLAAYPMLKYLKYVGSVLVLLVIIIIMLVLITERSFINGVKKGSKKVYDTAKNQVDKHYENRAALEEVEEYEDEKELPRRFRKAAKFYEEQPQKEPEKPKPRVEKKVSGITANTDIKASTRNQQFNNPNMHEIIFDESDYEKEEYVEPVIKQEIKPEPEGFAFDLYHTMPEPKGEHLKKVEKPAMDVQNDINMNGSSFKIDGADTFGEALEQGYKPKQAPHSFGRSEGYQTPDEKKLAQKPIVQAAKPMVNPKKYKYPPITLLNKGNGGKGGDSARELKETAARLQQTLQTFGVNVTITDISQGPAVTRYEMQPEVGVKVSKIVSLADDIKLNLAATDIRIEAPIPGKAAVGIEVPNKENSAVALRDLLESDNFKSFDSNLSFAVGKDISGQTVVFDIAKMPHVLIAGSTGSGKSVCINTLIMSILYKAHPDDVKLIMVDPKVVELSVYNGIPHLLIPVVTDPKKATAALQWAVAEMTERYKKFADQNVRDLKGYNKLAESMAESSEPDKPMKMPQIVVIIDELADLMMVASGEVEEAIVRLAQLARAAGIHLVIATQRPSVDVITGLIKANMPSRVAFAVSSGVDSRTILDMNGAEKLLGKGDMLFYPQGYPKPARVQGAFVSDKEVQDVVEFLKDQSLDNSYAEELEQKITSISSGSNASGASGTGSDLDELFAEAGQFIIEKDKASIGMLQRAFRIGFNRAARIMDQLADAGVVGEEEGTKPRKVLMSITEFENFLENN